MVVGLTYSVIAPLISIFCTVAFSMLMVVYHHHTAYVAQTQDKSGGEFYIRAINQLFVGLYVMELSLIGLFLLVRDIDISNGNAVGNPCAIQAIIMSVIFILTIVFQYLLNRAFNPLFRKFIFLPRDVGHLGRIPSHKLTSVNKNTLGSATLNRHCFQPDLFDLELPTIWVPSIISEFIQKWNVNYWERTAFLFAKKDGNVLEVDDKNAEAPKPTVLYEIIEDKLGRNFLERRSFLRKLA